GWKQPALEDGSARGARVPSNGVHPRRRLFMLPTAKKHLALIESVDVVGAKRGTPPMAPRTGTQLPCLELAPVRPFLHIG
ncbi:MAG: hypothetical protein EBT09_06090, partial [Actinobacteria bacterium]|nr:hypothetical protein [Actinomycetota bacterium]